jgi:formylglycine-generating enzyme required for sulfatase activity
MRSGGVQTLHGAALVAGALSMLSGCGGIFILDPECLPGWRWDPLSDRCVVEEIYFEGGLFVMGRGYCDPLEEHPEEVADGRCELRDKPHAVFVAPFYMDATEFPAGLARVAKPACPTMTLWCDKDSLWATNNDLESAQRVCESSGKTLPTEAQWEFAASGGGQRIYPWGNDPPACEHLWVRGLDTCPPPSEDFLRLSKYPPSPEGLYDLAGNLNEWVLPSSEGYTESYPPLWTANPDCTPHCRGCTCEFDGTRGGVLDNRREFLRAAHRATDKFMNLNSAGYRCVRNL